MNEKLSNTRADELLKIWTQDQRALATRLVATARNATPFSNAYQLGSLDATGPAAIPNPSHAFRLQWHEALLGTKSGNASLSSEYLKRLTRLHCLANLETIREIVSKDPNYKLQPDRYPQLKGLITSITP